MNLSLFRTGPDGARPPWLRFGGAVAAISGPTAIGSVISFLSTPLFVFWFPPEQFGELGFALAFASILSSLVSLRLELLVFREPPEAASLIAAQAVLLVMVIASAIFAMVAAIASQVALDDYLGGLSAAEIILSAYVLTVTICIANVGSAMCVVQSRYLASALPRTIGAVATLAFAAMLRHSNFADAVGGGLLMANLLAQTLAAACYLAFIGWAGMKEATFRGAFDLVRHNAAYVKFAAPQNSVAIAAFLNSAIILIGHFYGAAAAGQLFLAFRIVGFPSTVLGGAVGNVIAKDANRISPAWLRRQGLMMLGAAALIYLPLGSIGIAVPERLLPEEWRASLDMIAPVALLCAAQFVAGSFSQLLLIWDRAALLLVWDGTRLVFTSCVLVFAHQVGALGHVAVWCFVLAQVPFYAALFAIIRRASQVRMNRQARVATLPGAMPEQVA